MTGKQIAQKYNVSLSTVQNRLRSFGMTSWEARAAAKEEVAVRGVVPLKKGATSLGI
jgi:transposase